MFPRKILPNIEAINEVHFIFGSCGHRVLWLSNLKVMYIYPIGKNEQTLNYWYLGNALAALLVLCEGGTRTTLTCQKKIYINNYFKLICFVTTLTWKNYIYIYIYIYTLKIYIISVNSIGKISNSRIRDLWFNPHLYQKLISVLTLW